MNSLSSISPADDRPPSIMPQNNRPDGKLLDLALASAAKQNDFYDQHLAPTLRDIIAKDSQAYSTLGASALALCQQQQRAGVLALRDIQKTSKSNSRELALVANRGAFQNLCGRHMSVADLEDTTEKIESQLHGLKLLRSTRYDSAEADLEQRNSIFDSQWAAIARTTEQQGVLSTSRMKPLSAAMALVCLQAANVAEYLEKRITFLGNIAVQLAELELKARDSRHQEAKSLREYDIRKSRLEVENLLDQKRHDLDAWKARASHDLRETCEERDHAIRAARQELDQQRHADRHELDRIEQRLKARGLMSFLFS